MSQSKRIPNCKNADLALERAIIDSVRAAHRRAADERQAAIARAAQGLLRFFTLYDEVSGTTHAAIIRRLYLSPDSRAFGGQIAGSLELCVSLSTLWRYRKLYLRVFARLLGEESAAQA